MLTRQLEREFNEDADEAGAYNQMDHVAVNVAFVQDLLASGCLSGGPVDSEADDSIILDVGTGPALIPVELCRHSSSCQIVAVDAAVAMLDIARINVAVGGCEHRIQLQKTDCKQLDFNNDLFDGVMSNSLLHHLPEPLRGMAEMLRVCKAGGWLFVRDLMRPDTSEQIERLVGEHAGNEPPGNQQLLRQSLHAALTIDEVRSMITSLGLPADRVTATSDRHWTIAINHVKL